MDTVGFYTRFGWTCLSIETLMDPILHACSSQQLCLPISATPNMASTLGKIVRLCNNHQKAMPLQTEAGIQLEEEVEKLGKQGSISAEEAHAIYSLAVRLEYPLMADTEASMGQLLRQCSRLRVSDEGEARRAYLDVLQVIAGAYFGQDMALRDKYREHGVHV